MKYGLLAGLVFTTASYASIDLKANEQPLPVTVDQQAVAKIPANYKFVEPGTLTVAISALNSPPLALLASDNRTRIGSDPDIARLLAGSLGLKLKLVPTAWEDWPLGITSGRYDVALVNIAVTEQRKAKFDFATYRVDSLAFSVKSTSNVQSITRAKDLAGKKVIVGSGTNQERILLGWNEEKRTCVAGLSDRRRLRQSLYSVRQGGCFLWTAVRFGLQSRLNRQNPRRGIRAEESLCRHHNQKR